MNMGEYVKLLQNEEIVPVSPTINRAKNVIVVFALQRSGHHAVINWIRNQFEGNSIFYNDIGWPCHSGNNLGVNHNKWFGKNPHAYAYNYWLNDKFFRTPPATVMTNIPEVDTVVWNYEEFDLEDFDQDAFRHMVDEFVKSYDNLIPVIVTRDAFNLAASRYKGSNGKNPLSIDKWIEYAHEATFGDIIEGNVPIDYSTWNHDMAYREFLFKQLDGDKYVEELEDISPHGSGSSFDRKARKVSDMGVDSFNLRWKNEDVKEEMKRLLEHERLVELHKYYYGSRGEKQLQEIREYVYE